MWATLWNVHLQVNWPPLGRSHDINNLVQGNIFYAIDISTED